MIPISPAKITFIMANRPNISIGTIIGPGFINVPPRAGCKIVAAPEGSDSMTNNKLPTVIMPIKTARRIDLLQKYEFWLFEQF